MHENADATLSQQHEDGDPRFRNPSILLQAKAATMPSVKPLDAVGLCDAVRSHVMATRHMFLPLERQPGHGLPIPYFGPLQQAVVLTLGLNPSSEETAGDRWPKELSAAYQAERLNNYFLHDRHAANDWFDPWVSTLAELDLTYSENAAHIDLSPRPTRSAGSFPRGTEKHALFKAMLRCDAPTVDWAVTSAARCRLILAAGSVPGYLPIVQFIRRDLSGSGFSLEAGRRIALSSDNGFVEESRIVFPGGRALPLWFCSSGPSFKKGAVLLSAVREHKSGIERLLGRPNS